MDVKKDQDVRLKVGYEVIEKVNHFANLQVVYSVSHLPTNQLVLKQM